VARSEGRYVHALRFSALTALYDPVVALTTRERRVKGALLDAAGLGPGRRVLDVGCGTGTLAIEAARRVPGLTVCGLDGDPEVLERARRKAARAGVAVAFQLGLSYDLPYERAGFDRVLSSLFFHHLTTEDKRRTFREIFRVTRPGGELHVADWGRPQNVAMRAAYLGIRLLDGFETTRDNVRGLLPALMAEAGFAGARVVKELPTMFGTMTIYSAFKPAGA
jgi:ubiquinone/menaquinone biosynthesis C-methylase UbiE